MNNELHLPDFSAKTVNILLDLLYTGRAESQVTALEAIPKSSPKLSIKHSVKPYIGAFRTLWHPLRELLRTLNV